MPAPEAEEVAEEGHSVPAPEGEELAEEAPEGDAALLSKKRWLAFGGPGAARAERQSWADSLEGEMGEDGEEEETSNVVAPPSKYLEWELSQQCEQVFSFTRRSIFVQNFDFSEICTFESVCGYTRPYFGFATCV